MMSIILHHWAFYAFVVWVVVVVTVNLRPRRACGQADTSSKLYVDATCQSEKAVEDLRMKSVRNSSSPRPDRVKAKDLTG
jgi:hypothetical protein